MKDGLPTRPLSELLGQYMQRAGLEGALLQRSAWERAAGEHLARHVVPVDRRDGVLLLVADSVQWQQARLHLQRLLLPLH